ncbi:hypothetical protein HJG60_011336 [Phyllostomus discolor]|uniref:Uncharacterized protein n=1 Tax=Phyllostomus discolor TaxID=89673 RepID=A0A834E7R3_9CHIR|nr:hypothetical protein HJG60_011336 [Phyllostomus discolor]
MGPACCTWLLACSWEQPTCKMLDSTGQSQMGMCHGGHHWLFGANTNNNCVWRRKAKNVLGQHTGELSPLPNLTCILCVTQRRLHAAVKRHWKLVHTAAAYQLHVLHKPLKLSEMWSSFSSIVLMRKVG